MFCTNCGEKLGTRAAFCSGCGKRAETAPTASPPVVQNDMGLSEGDIKIIQAYKTQGDFGRMVNAAPGKTDSRLRQQPKSKKKLWIAFWVTLIFLPLIFLITFPLFILHPIGLIVWLMPLILLALALWASGDNVKTTIAGVLLTIGGIIGLFAVIGYANQPNNTFQFGGGSGWTQCETCWAYTMVLVAAIPALIAGIKAGVSGVIKISSNK
ncbi:MAG: zinc ribbon domain-containing protein [Clostridiales bacterium]|jgi:hypothetical protein|nr:zinc ribbon domain-containing protein [Clostridiales bacterium]